MDSEKRVSIWARDCSLRVYLVVQNIAVISKEEIARIQLMRWLVSPFREISSLRVHLSTIRTKKPLPPAKAHSRRIGGWRKWRVLLGEYHQHQISCRITYRVCELNDHDLPGYGNPLTPKWLCRRWRSANQVWQHTLLALNLSS